MCMVFSPGQHETWPLKLRVGVDWATLQWGTQRCQHTDVGMGRWGCRPAP